MLEARMWGCLAWRLAEPKEEGQNWVLKGMMISGVGGGGQRRQMKPEGGRKEGKEERREGGREEGGERRLQLHHSPRRRRAGRLGRTAAGYRVDDAEGVEEDIGDVDSLMRMGYRTLMLGDDICMRRESVMSALNLLYAMGGKYG